MAGDTNVSAKPQSRIPSSFFLLRASLLGACPSTLLSILLSAYFSQQTSLTLVLNVCPVSSERRVTIRANERATQSSHGNEYWFARMRHRRGAPSERRTPCRKPGNLVV